MYKAIFILLLFTSSLSAQSRYDTASFNLGGSIEGKPLRGGFLRTGTSGNGMIVIDTVIPSYTTGTVTSVGISGTNGISVLSGSPITTSGTIALGITNGSIGDSSLANSSFTLNGNSISLGGSKTLTLASSDFVNQGTTTQVLHGNVAGNPSWSQIATGDISGAAVTLAKIQNAGSNSIILGSGSSGSGSPYSEISLGSGLSMSGTVLSATGTGGTVTSVSVIANNGLTQSVSTPTTTPAITLGISAGGIANASLTNSSITIAGNVTALGSSVTLDQITGVSSNGYLKRTGANTLTNITSIGNSDLSNSSINFTSTGSTLNVPASIALGLTGNFDLNLATANTWTGAITVNKAGIATVYTTGFLANNSTLSTSLVPKQISPSYCFWAHGYSSTGAGGDSLFYYRITDTVQNGSVANSALRFDEGNPGKGYTQLAALTDAGYFNVETGFQVNGTTVLNSNTLGSGIVNSSLTSVGTLTSGSIGSGFTAIPNSALANSSITINGSSVSLGGTRTLTLASSDFANQGTTTTVLHGNGSGNPSFASIATGDIAANAVTYAKMQAVSGTSLLLGSSATTKAVQEITLGTGLSMSGTTLNGSAGASGANPTASLGLSAINGSASTFMRSDAAPALDVTIAPTWTGLHTWIPTSATTNAQVTTETFGLNSTGTAATNFGQKQIYNLSSATVNNRNAAQIAVDWSTATDVSRTSRLRFYNVFNAGSLQEVLRFDGNNVNFPIFASQGLLTFGSSGLLTVNTIAPNSIIFVFSSSQVTGTNTNFTYNGTTQTINNNGIATTFTKAISYANTTAATSGVPVQQSGSAQWLAHDWSTTATAHDSTGAADETLVPISSANPLTYNLTWRLGNGGTNMVTEMTLSNAGILTATNSLIANTSLGGSTTPTSGGHYKDNVVIAWGNIAANGTIGSQFGNFSVSHTASTGVYTITLPTTPSAAICTISPQSLSLFNVTISGATITVNTDLGTIAVPIATDVAFFFIVTGRP